MPSTAKATGKSMPKENEYHLQFFGPLKNEYVDWPAGSVSVYRITGAQIAQRTAFKQTVIDGATYNTNEVLTRDSWPGYGGCFKSLAEAMAWIEGDRN